MSEILSPDKNPAYGDWTACPALLWEKVASLEKRIFDVDPRNPIRILSDFYHLPFLGKTLLVNPQTRQLKWLESENPPTFQEGLVALTYLGHYKPIALSKRWISPIELPGARTFFSPGSHPPPTTRVLDCWVKRYSGFLQAIHRLGGTTVSIGDEAIEIPCLPLLPIRYIFYREEKGLPATVTPLVNATLHLLLPPDVVWALMNLVDQEFSKND